MPPSNCTRYGVSHKASRAVSEGRRDFGRAASRSESRAPVASPYEFKRSREGLPVEATGSVLPLMVSRRNESSTKAASRANGGPVLHRDRSGFTVRRQIVLDP